MKLKEFLRLMKMPILIIGGVIIIFSFMSYFFGFQLTLIKNTGLVTWVIYDVIYQLDYTHEVTFASWFQSLLFLFTAAGFFLIGWGDREKLKISSIQQGVIKLFSIVMFFLSVDEILCLRDQLGRRIEFTTGLLDNTNIEHLGYSGFLVYIPLALAGIVFFSFIFKKLIKNIRNVKQRVLTYRYFKLIIFLIPIYLILIFSEIYLLIFGHPIKLIFYIEELIKLGIIYSVYNFVLKISDNYNL